MPEAPKQVEQQNEDDQDRQRGADGKIDVVAKPIDRDVARPIRQPDRGGNDDGDLDEKPGSAAEGHGRGVLTVPAWIDWRRAPAARSPSGQARRWPDPGRGALWRLQATPLPLPPVCPATHRFLP